MDTAKSLLVLIVVGALGTATHVSAQSWTGNTSPPPAASSNRYSQAVSSTGASISAGAQNAFNNSSAAVQDGFNDGVRAAQQSVTNSINSSIPSSPWTTPAASTAPASSTWTSNPISPSTSTTRPAVTTTAIPGGWTSIGSSVSPPPLLVPQANMATPNLGPATRSVASYPAAASNDPPPLHSVLADPAKSAAPATTNTTDDWASGFNNTAGSAPATIGRSNASLPPLGTTTSSLDSDPWNQPSSPNLGAANGAVSVNRPPSSPSATNNNAFGSNPPPNNNFGGFANNNTPPTNAQSMGTFNMAGTPNPNMNATANNGMTLIGSGGAKNGQNNSGEPQPWMPLIASVLTLAGSLAANLYLGVSYLDARQKYQSLVRKTADTFRRVKAVAA